MASDKADKILLAIKTDASSTAMVAQIFRGLAVPLGEPELVTMAERLVGAENCSAVSASTAKGAVLKAARRHLERPMERIAREAEELLADYDARGGGASAARKIARKRCPGDPAAEKTMAQRIRALVRARRRKCAASARPD